MADQPSSCGSIPGAKFFGVSVVDFNASAGWGAQSSEVTINLAADCDEAFVIPTVGMAATFAMGSFSFTGLVQSWNSKQGSDGELYTVKLISPHPILDNTQVILDHYEGSVPFFNIINVYGFLESIGANCSQKEKNGTVFGAPAGGFGTANKTGRGIPWYLIQQALQALTGGIGQNATYCKGLKFRDTKYILDLSSIPLANQNYRITGPVMSLTEIINQVCEDAGCDYYIQMFPGGFASGTAVIKVVTIPRTNQPAIDGISTFIQGQNIINKAMGNELRSEVNSSLLIGGKVKQYYQCTDTEGITPFWGWDAEGELLKSRQTDASELNWEVELDFRKINLALNFPVPNSEDVDAEAGKNWVGENELRAAAGNYESFQKLIQNPGNEDSVLYKYFTDTLKMVLTDPQNKDQGGQDAAMNVKIHAADDDPTGDPASKQLRDAKALHQWLSSYASEVYGKQFLVYFSLDSVVCKAVDSDTKQVTYSDIVSTDGAWPSSGNAFTDATTIFGLDNPSNQTDFFKDESGKVQPMIKFSASGDNALSTKGLSNDSFIVEDKNIWIKATVDEKWVKGTPTDSSQKDKIRGALISLSNGVIDTESDEATIETNRLVDPTGFSSTGKTTASPVVKLDGDVVKGRKIIGGQGEMVGALGPSYKLDPDGIGVPLQSTTTCYGPWQAAGADPGSTHVEVDDGLVPWEYGGFEMMDDAGNAKIKESFTNQQEAARGEVSIPGLPQRSLATNINDGQGVSSSYDTMPGNIGSSFNYSFYKFNSTLAGGAVISNISVSVGAGGVTTAYTVNSFTPVFGRFSKGNAERLKQIGLNRQRGEREMRARTALRNLIRASERRTDVAGAVAEDIGKGNVAPKSPAIAFAGKLISDSTSYNIQRKIVLSPTKTTMPFYATSEGDKTSVMTMDGFFRPVQSTGSNKGNLPKVVSDTGGCDSLTQTTGPPPPVQKIIGEEGDGSPVLGDINSLNISTTYLNFLTNPRAEDHDNVNDSWIGKENGRAPDSTGGHDIEGVARGNAGEEWGSKNPGKLLMQSGSLTGNERGSDYNDDYRFMALRGPLMIHGWGYDINGKPIPNKQGDSVGSFTTNYTNLKNEFADNWLEDSRTWPVAPVDLRFDRQRGVWTTPSAFRLYQITTSGDIGPGSYGAAVVTKTITDVLNDDGTPVQDPIVEVENWTNMNIASGASAMAYYDTAECKYWIIPPPSGASGVVKVGTTGCCEADDPAYSDCIPCTGTTGCLVFGSGLEGSWITDAGGDFLIVGPKVQSGDCSGNPVGQPESFSQITFGSGLRPVKTDTCEWFVGGPTIQESGCDAKNPPQYLENLVIGSGLGFSGTDCVVTITGPQIQSGDCEGTPIAEPAYFDNLVFLSGMRITKDEDDECEWHIAGPSIQESGCDNKKEPQALGNLVIGSGLKFTELPPDDPSDCNILISGPQIQSGECDGTPIGESVPFNNLIFVSGLRATRTEPDGCEWKISGPEIHKSGCEKDATPIPYEKLIIGSGITTTQNPGGEPCSVLITGPRIQSGACNGSAIGEAEAFNELRFVSGMRITKDAECKWKIAGPTIQDSGCGAAGSVKGLGNLIIGTGIHYSEQGDCGAVIHGPKILSILCGNPAINSHFDQITFTSGLRVHQEAESGPNACKFKVGGPTIQQDNCEGNGNRVSLSNLIIGSGLDFVPKEGDDCHYVVSGPKVEVHGACGLGLVGETFFDKLIFANGFFGTWEDDCDLTIKGPKILNNNVCSAEVGATDHFDILAFGKGLNAVFQSSVCRWSITGPEIKLTDCGRTTVNYGAFTQLAISSGLSVTAKDELGCEFAITGPQIFQEAAVGSSCLGGDGLKVAVSPFSFMKLKIGKGLNLTQSVCDATLEAGTYFEQKEDVCGHITKIDPVVVEKLTIDRGLKLEKDGDKDGCYKLKGPRIGNDVLAVGKNCKDQDNFTMTEFYDLKIGDGLLLVKDTIGQPEGETCAFYLRGPTVSMDATLDGTTERTCKEDGVDPFHFCDLQIGDGLKLVGGDANEGLPLKAAGRKKIESCGFPIGSYNCIEEEAGEHTSETLAKYKKAIYIGVGLSLTDEDESNSPSPPDNPFEGSVLRGPKVAKSGTCLGDPADDNFAATHFDELVFSGLQVEKVDCATYKVSGPTIQADNCSNWNSNDPKSLDPSEKRSLSNLIIGSGLSITPSPFTSDACDWKITGPKLTADNCSIDGIGAITTAAPIGTLVFKGGIIVQRRDVNGKAFPHGDGAPPGCEYHIWGTSITTEDDPDPTPDDGSNSPSILRVGYGTRLRNTASASCDKTIEWSGLPLGTTGCGINPSTECLDNIVKCTYIGDGLHLEGEGDNKNIIKGSKLDDKFFKNLTIGDNLSLVADGVPDGTSDTCEYTLSGTMGTLQVGSSGCGVTDVECATMTGCLVFDEGLKGERINGGVDFKVTGPTIASRGDAYGACDGTDMTGGSFSQLLLGTGLYLQESPLGECVYNLDVCPIMNIGETGCDPDPALPENKECFIHDCLVVGPGLNLSTSKTNQIKGTNFGVTSEFPGGAFAKKFTLKNLEVIHLSTEEDKRCHYMLSGSAPTKIKTGLDNCVGGVQIGTPQELSILNIGSGLRIANIGGGSEGNYTIEACGSGGGGGGCEGGLNTGVPVVTQVCCSGASFITVKRTLEFTDGCLTDVSPDQSCPTC